MTPARSTRLQKHARPTRLPVLAVLAVLAIFPSLACGKSPSEPDKGTQGGTNGAKSTAPSASPAADQAGFAGPMLAEDQLRLMTAPPGDDVVAIVKAERARQAALGRSVIVYAGAKWCEPCQHFHKAAAAGKLDKAFPKLTIVEFDVDTDGDRLKRAGYRSKFIPLFVVPDENGQPTDRRLEGSVKGDGAVDEIVPRLRRILSSS